MEIRWQKIVVTLDTVYMFMNSYIKLDNDIGGSKGGGQGGHGPDQRPDKNKK